MDSYQAFTLIFTGIVAVSTIVYARLTSKLVSETRKMRKVQTDPIIAVFIQQQDDHNLLDLIIQNIGLGPAYDIKFELNGDIDIVPDVGRPVSERNFIKNGIKYLAPNKKISCYLTDLLEKTSEKEKTSIEVTVHYEDNLKNPYENNYTINLSEWIGLLSIDGKPKPLETIAKDINKFVTHYIKINKTG